MEGLIGGAISGMTAVYLGLALISSFSKVVTPVGEKITQRSAMAPVTGLVPRPPYSQAPSL